MFETHPSRYKHWKLSFDGDVATLVMAVDADHPHKPGYELKLNSYDLSVDIELADAIQRIRFEHPEVKCVVFTAELHPAAAAVRKRQNAVNIWKTAQPLRREPRRGVPGHGRRAIHVTENGNVIARPSSAVRPSILVTRPAHSRSRAPSSSWSR